VRTLSNTVIRSSTALVTESRAHQSTNNVGCRAVLYKLERRFYMYTVEGNHWLVY
jgi:3-methyladenine DNA glycosylase Mpg